MGACATKPKVETGKAPEPVTDEKVVEDGKEGVIGTTCTREIVEVGKEVEEVSDKAKGVNKEAEITEELKSESINVEKTSEKIVELKELLKQEQPSDLEKQVLTEAGTSDGCKSEPTGAEVTKLPAPQVVISEALKLPEADTKVTAVAPETLSNETSKTSEVTKTEDIAPVVVPKSEIPKPSDVIKSGNAEPIVSKVETPEKKDADAPASSVTVAPTPIESSKKDTSAETKATVEAK